MPGYDPGLNVHFGVDAGSFIQNAIFTEVSGIGSETDVAEFKTVSGLGNDHVGYINMVPGRHKWEKITLKRGIASTTNDGWQWRKMVTDGNVEGARTNATITMYDDKGTIMAQWALFRCWPCKLSGPSPKSDSSEVGIEEMQLVCEGVERLS